MAVQNRKSGLLAGLIAALFAAFVIGFCYGFVVDPPANQAKPNAHTDAPEVDKPVGKPVIEDTVPPNSRPEVTVTPVGGGDHEDMGSLPLTSIIDIEMTPEKRAAQEEEAARRIAELTREAMNKFGKVDPDARKPKTPNTKPGQPTSGVGDKGTVDVEVVPFSDPEQDLISSKPVPPVAEKPENLSADAEKGDQLLEQAMELMRKWDKLRTQKGGVPEVRRLMDQAKKTLDQAKTCYRKATAAEPDSTYIKQQLELANQLHYAAMKSSSF